MSLTPGQMIALRNLSAKHAGEDVAWIGIADARALTDLGLAQRTASGWEITRDGEAALAAAGADPAQEAPNTVHPIGR